MPKRKTPSGIKVKCIVCGEKFDFISATFSPICNKCRKYHEDSKKREVKPNSSQG
jgi:hypothetical protein